jgi:hypothetical protein
LCNTPPAAISVLDSILSFFVFPIFLVSLAIGKNKKYFLMSQTLKLNNEKWKKISLFYEEKSFEELNPDLINCSG